MFRCCAQNWLRSRMWIAALVIGAYLAMAFSFAARKTPWVDEGWIASAPANWARTGSFGTPSLQPTGSWLNAELTGIREYTYWNLPVAITAQGLWYKTIGFSVLKMRALSILAGMLALVSWFAIVAKLSGNRAAACLTVLILSFDFTFLWAAADGRMDMICAGLGAAGLASYLIWRERSFYISLWLANTLLALSLFTHPNGALYVAAFLILVWMQDRSRLSWRTSPVLTPYLLIAALWAAYALQRPDYFLAQMEANSMAIGGTRWAGLAHPLLAIKNEVLIRYLAHFGIYPLWGGEIPSYSLVIPISYWFLLVAAGVFWYLERAKGLSVLLCLTAIFVLAMTFLVGLKANAYLILVLPLYAASGAVFFCGSHSSRSAFAPVSLFLLTAILVCNVAFIASKLRHNPFTSEYQSTVEFIRAHLHPGEHVTADSYFGFDLGFERVNDDCRVGYYSGVRTQLIVEDLWYGVWWRTLFPGEEPELAHYVEQLLKHNYKVIFRSGQFRVYARRGT